MIQTQRFLRSKSTRADLFLLNSGLCSICRNPLLEHWHSDHIIPWSKGGITTCSNLQATCPKCNLIKGNKMPDKINYENLDYFNKDFPNSKNMRKCQIGAYNAIIDRIQNNENSCSVFLPTGTGKSDVVRAVSIGLKKRNLCSGTWVFSPNEELRNQVIKDEIKECFIRLGVFYETIPFSEETSLDNDRFRNNCILESYTTQFLINGNKDNSNVDRFIKHDKIMFKRTGKHVIAIFDESHLFSTDNKWGTTATKLQENGIPIVLITGTPYRSDNLKIPGFKTILVDVNDHNFTKTKKIDEEICIIKRGKERISKYKLVADYEYSYKRAIEDGVILKPNPMWVDATDLTYDKILSEMPKGESRKIMRSFLSNQETIKFAVESTIKSLACRKHNNADCCAIVTTLSDLDDDDQEDSEDKLCNIHAKKIEREFYKQCPSLKVRIVTSTEKPDDLDKFKLGNYDVLIVKAMGTIGFNYKPIKTVCHLSSYRTLPALIQLLMRGCRIYGKHNNFDAILVKDKAMIDLYSQLEAETGLTVISKEELESIEEIKEIEPCEPSDLLLSDYGNYNCSFNVTEKRNESDEVIELFRKKLPQQYVLFEDNQGILDYYIIMSKSFGKDWLQKLPDYETIQDVIMLDPNEEEYRLRCEANESVEEITYELIRTCAEKYSKEKYGKIIAPLWKCVKRCAGFPPASTLENIAGIENYKKLKKACERVKDKLNKISPSPHFNYLQFLNNIR